MTYLDEQGNPIGARPIPDGKTYLDDNGDPVAAPREYTNYRGLRIFRQGDKVEVNPTPTDAENAEMLRQTGEYLPAMASLASMGAPGAGGAIAKAITSPVGAGAIAGGLDYAENRNPISAAKAALQFGLLARLAPMGGKLIEPMLVKAGVGRGLLAALKATAAKAAPAVAEAVPAVEEAATAAYRGIPSLMNIAKAEMAPASGAAANAVGGAANILRGTAQSAAPQAAASVAEAAAPVVGAAEEAATPLMTRLRASVLLKQNPAQLAQEIEQKVVSLKGGVGKGLSAAQIGKTVEELYGVGTSEAKHMVKAIFDTYGF